MKTTILTNIRNQTMSVEQVPIFSLFQMSLVINSILQVMFSALRSRDLVLNNYISFPCNIWFILINLVFYNTLNWKSIISISMLPKSSELNFSNLGSSNWIVFGHRMKCKLVFISPIEQTSLKVYVWRFQIYKNTWVGLSD